MDTAMELEIGPGTEPGTYHVQVLRSVGGGEPTVTFRLDVDDLLERRSTLEDSVLSSSVAARRIVSTTEAAIQAVGRQLFDAVFDGEVSTAYRTSLAVASDRGKGVRIVLRLTAPELAALPWEALYDSETGTYLCRKEPLVRHVPAPYSPDTLELVPPLRVLAMISSPRGLPPLDIEAEKALLEEALGPHLEAGRVKIDWIDHVTWPRVHERLLEREWHVLHFIGHGTYDAQTDEGVLAFVGRDGRADYVTASALADLLSQAEPSPRLVLLNSCRSAAGGAEDLFSGTAAALVHSGIHAVAAMQFSVSDLAAIEFARGFYAALAHGRGIDEAVRSGRIGMLGVTRGTLEWVTPVLYLRGEDTKLFSVAPLPDADASEAPATPPAGIPGASPMRAPVAASAAAPPLAPTPASTTTPAPTAAPVPASMAASAPASSEPRPDSTADSKAATGPSDPARPIHTPDTGDSPVAAIPIIRAGAPPASPPGSGPVASSPASRPLPSTTTSAGAAPSAPPASQPVPLAAAAATAAAAARAPSPAPSPPAPVSPPVTAAPGPSTPPPTGPPATTPKQQPPGGGPAGGGRRWKPWLVVGLIAAALAGVVAVVVSNLGPEPVEPTPSASPEPSPTTPPPTDTIPTTQAVPVNVKQLWTPTGVFCQPGGSFELEAVGYIDIDGNGDGAGTNQVTPEGWIDNENTGPQSRFLGGHLHAAALYVGPRVPEDVESIQMDQYTRFGADGKALHACQGEEELALLIDDLVTDDNDGEYVVYMTRRE